MFIEDYAKIASRVGPLVVIFGQLLLEFDKIKFIDCSTVNTFSSY